MVSAWPDLRKHSQGHPHWRWAHCPKPFPWMWPSSDCYTLKHQYYLGQGQDWELSLWANSSENYWIMTRKRSFSSCLYYDKDDKKLKPFIFFYLSPVLGFSWPFSLDVSVQGLIHVDKSLPLGYISIPNAFLSFIDLFIQVFEVIHIVSLSFPSSKTSHALLSNSCPPFN